MKPLSVVPIVHDVAGDYDRLNMYEYFIEDPREKSKGEETFVGVGRHSNSFWYLCINSV